MLGDKGDKGDVGEREKLVGQVGPGDKGEQVYKAKRVKKEIKVNSRRAWRKGRSW
jgi:hypothetical protein